MTRHRFQHPLLWLAATLLAWPAGAQVVLPESAPAAAARSERPQERQFPAAPPPGAPASSTPSTASEEAPEPASPPPDLAVPVPTPAPRLIPPGAYEPPAAAEAPAPPEGAVQTTPPVAGQPMPAEETACRAALRSLGVSFEERPSISDPSGCGIDHPVAITSLGPGIDLEPEAVLNCPMAEAAARFAQQVIAPAATAEFGAELETVQHGSGYVCRPRNGTGKLSEHAFGNALDFSAFELEGGRRISVRSISDPAEQAFLTTLRKAACGPFTTVLGPGSDADHAGHFHFDLQPRRAGSTWCQ
jgi:hypothetical protein